MTAYPKFTALLPFVALAAGVSSCGDDNSRPAPQAPFVEVVPMDLPAAYELADADCQSQKDKVTLTSTTLPSWSGFNVVSEAVDLHGMESGASLTSAAAFETTYGRLYQRRCTWDQDRPGFCPDARGDEKGWDLTDQGKPLRICSPGRAYPRTSYEGVALTSMHFLARAHARFTEETAAAAVAPRVSLQILPHFVSFYDGYQENGKAKRLAKYLTRNLAYFPRQSGLAYPMIVVWPEPSVTSAGWVGGLWESGFVLAHEFGHHLEFSVLNQKGARAETLRWDPIRHQYEDLSPDGIAAGGITSHSQARKSVSEAFADLIGFYTDGHSSRGISGMPCFGYNRDVENAFFEGPHPKILTAEVLQELFTGPARSDCDGGKPSFGDAHLVGAIIAHGTHRILTHALALAGGDTSDLYRLTLTWMRSLRQSQEAATADETPQKGSGLAALFPLKAGIEAAVNELTPIDAATVLKEVCREFKELFPALDVPAFADENGLCLP